MRTAALLGPAWQATLSLSPRQHDAARATLFRGDILPYPVPAGWDAVGRNSRAI